MSSHSGNSSLFYNFERDDDGAIALCQCFQELFLLAFYLADRKSFNVWYLFMRTLSSEPGDLNFLPFQAGKESLTTKVPKYPVEEFQELQRCFECTCGVLVLDR